MKLILLEKEMKLLERYGIYVSRSDTYSCDEIEDILYAMTVLACKAHNEDNEGLATKLLHIYHQIFDCIELQYGGDIYDQYPLCEPM